MSNFAEARMCLRAVWMLLSGTVFPGCFGAFASPCSFQEESVGCTGWPELLKFGNLKAAGQTGQYYHIHPSLLQGRAGKCEVMAIYTVLLVMRRGRLTSISLHCLWFDTLCWWGLLLSLGALNCSLEPGLALCVHTQARIFWALYFSASVSAATLGRSLMASDWPDKLVYAFSFAYNNCYSPGCLCNLRFLCFPHEMLATDLEMECQIRWFRFMTKKIKCIEILFSDEINWGLHEAASELWKPEVCRLDMCMGSPPAFSQKRNN